MTPSTAENRYLTNVFRSNKVHMLGKLYKKFSKKKEGKNVDRCYKISWQNLFNKLSFR